LCGSGVVHQTNDETFRDVVNGCQSGGILFRILVRAGACSVGSQIDAMGGIKFAGDRIANGLPRNVLDGKPCLE
jgi:hypothetical protein